MNKNKKIQKKNYKINKLISLFEILLIVVAIFAICLSSREASAAQPTPVDEIINENLNKQRYFDKEIELRLQTPAPSNTQVPIGTSSKASLQNPAGGNPSPTPPIVGRGSVSTPINSILSKTQIAKEVTPEMVSQYGFDKIPNSPGAKIFLKTSEGEYFIDKNNNLYKINGPGNFQQIGQAPAGVAPYQSTGPFGLWTTNNYFLGKLLEGATYSIAAFFAVKMIASILGASEKRSTAFGAATAAGIMSYKLSLGLFGKGSTTQLGSGGILGKFITQGQAALIGIGVAIVVFLIMDKKEKTKIVRFQCLPFEPPLGGKQCEECNKDPFRPCSEYRCKSLGQACELLNPNTGSEMCAWVSKFDVTSPTIEPWDEALYPYNLKLKYEPDNAIRPPNRGVKIVAEGREGGCLPAFTPLQFGIKTNEAAQCKIDYGSGGNIQNSSFESMAFYFGETNYYLYNHTQKMILPGAKSGEGSASPTLPNDGVLHYYVKCRDANGNTNVDVFVFSMCVDKGPDTTPPLIEGTSIISGKPVQYNVDSVPIEVYVNEPSTCKWSKEDKAYSDMENTLSCPELSYQMNTRMQYVCKGNLTGVVNRAENNFYFRCKDKPNAPEKDRIENTQSYKLMLRGTQPLNILNVGPNGTIYGSTTTIPVKLEVTTDDGADEGRATCSFSINQKDGLYIPMFKTNNTDGRSEQTVYLTSGIYIVYFKCIDEGGNLASSNTTFLLYVDKESPKITRIYKETDALKIITNEDSRCYYSLTTCNFNMNESVEMSYINPDNKRALIGRWVNNAVYYIKCKDYYGNEPNPNECTLIASASQITEITQKENR